MRTWTTLLIIKARQIEIMKKAQFIKKELSETSIVEIQETEPFYCVM